MLSFRNASGGAIWFRETARQVRGGLKFDRRG